MQHLETNQLLGGPYDTFLLVRVHGGVFGSSHLLNKSCSVHLVNEAIFNCETCIAIARLNNMQMERAEYDSHCF